MGVSQAKSFSKRFIRFHALWQIENKTAQLATEVFWIHGVYMRQQLFHVKQDHFMSAEVLLAQMQDQVSRAQGLAALETVPAQKLKHVQVLPQR